MPALIALAATAGPVVALVGGMVLSTNSIRREAIARENKEIS